MVEHVTMWTYTVPNHVFEKIVGGFIQQTADEMLGQHRGRSLLHPGDPFGQLIAWVWENHPDEAPHYVADLLSELRYHRPGADQTITLDDLLAGLQFAIAPNMSGADADALTAALRAGVPDYFDADVTSRPGEG
jgi:hypothetical protein